MNINIEIVVLELIKSTTSIFSLSTLPKSAISSPPFLDQLGQGYSREGAEQKITPSDFEYVHILIQMMVLYAFQVVD